MPISGPEELRVAVFEPGPDFGPKLISLLQTYVDNVPLYERDLHNAINAVEILQSMGIHGAIVGQFDVNWENSKTIVKTIRQLYPDIYTFGIVEQSKLSTGAHAKATYPAIVTRLPDILKAMVDYHNSSR